MVFWRGVFYLSKWYKLRRLCDQAPFFSFCPNQMNRIDARSMEMRNCMRLHFSPATFYLNCNSNYCGNSKINAKCCIRQTMRWNLHGNFKLGKNSFPTIRYVDAESEYLVSWTLHWVCCWFYWLGGLCRCIFYIECNFFDFLFSLAKCVCVRCTFNQKTMASKCVSDKNT